VRVRFLALPSTAVDSLAFRRPTYVCPVESQRCASFLPQSESVTIAADVTSDDAGRAYARMQFGVVAGPGAIQVSVPDSAVSTSIPFSTRPGSLARIVVAVRDTAVYIGAVYPLGEHAADRFGNTRPEAVNLTAATPTVIAIASGLVTAIGLGRGRILMQSGALADTAHVSVPPPGRLVAFGWGPDFGALTQLTLVNTDGSGRRLVLSTSAYNGSALPVWSPDGHQIIYQDWGANSHGELRITDTLGNWRVLLPSPLGFTQSLQAVYSADGSALYFFGSQQSTGQTGVYRAGVDGTDPQFLFPGLEPAPSPDGSRIAYLSGTSLFVRDLATGEARPIAPEPALPRWAPAGDLIAFVWDNGQQIVNLVRPDGTALRTVGPGFHDLGLSWSPDGTWLAVARSGGGLELIRVADGERLPIPAARDLSQPDWRSK